MKFKIVKIYAVLLFITRICFSQQSGQLNGSDQCGVPDNGINADVITQNISGIQFADYTCHLGHRYTYGNVNLTCIEPGVWTGTKLICTECGEPPTEMYSTWGFNPPSNENQIQYTCIEEYELSSSGPTDGFCASGLWILDLFQCVEICRNKHFLCPYWSSIGYCMFSPETIIDLCSLSCDEHCMCPNVITTDIWCDCPSRAKSGECEIDLDVVANCSETCNLRLTVVCPLLPPPGDVNAVLSTTDIKYLTDVSESCVEGFRPINTVEIGRQVCTDTGAWLKDSFAGNSIACQEVTCPFPPEITGATKTTNGSTYSDYVSYTCNVGYELAFGILYRTCTQPGLWSGPQPVCTRVTCSMPETIVFGSVTYDGSFYEDVTTYSCGVNYFMLSGSPERMCNSSAEWSGTLPVCVAEDCPLHVDVANATAVYSGRHYSDTVEFTCDTGFTGGETLACMPSGIWFGNTPVCTTVDCGQPNPVASTSETLTGTTYLETVTYACSDGYEYVSGDMNRTCNADASWSIITPPVCQAFTCPLPVMVANSSFVQSGNNYNDTVLYVCDTGFTLSAGDLLRTCISANTWNAVIPVCSVIDCGNPPDFQDATKTYVATVYPDTVTYSCITGRTLASGDSVHTCGLTGVWTGDPPDCQIVDCGPVPSYPNTVNNYSGTTYLETVTYTCADGYLHSSGDLIHTCDDTGTWSGLDAVCDPITCPTPTPISNAAYVLEGLFYGDDVTYSCDSGFAAISGNLVRTCSGLGVWDVTAVTCGAITCSTPESAPGGTFVVNGLAFNDIVTYSCDAGNTPVSGGLVRTCIGSGVWSGTLVTCQATVQCPQPPTYDDVSVILSGTSYQDTATYSCNHGYQHTSGDLVHECSNSGSWSGAPPICEEVVLHCQNPATYSHTNFILHGTLYQDTVSYSCMFGYKHVSGDLEHVCSADALWEGTPPVCEVTICGIPPSIALSSVTTQSTVYLGQAKYRCIEGYQHVGGSNVKVCQIIWTGDDIVCQIVSCGEPDIIPNSVFNFTGIYYEDRVSYRCIVRMEEKHVGQWSRSCAASGSWEGEDPPCEIAKRKKFVPVPVEASGSLEVGVMAVGILSVIIIGIMLLDLRTIWEDLKGLKKNLGHFKASVSGKIGTTFNLPHFGKYTPRV